MRFDVLDEYSTLVPFGLGVSKRNRPQYPTIPVEAAKRGIIANCVNRLKVLFGKSRGQTARVSFSRRRTGLKPP